MSLQFVPFHDDLLHNAATLLAARHRRDRAFLHELPARFEEPANARKALEAAWRRPGASGAAALDGGRLIGYAIGDPVTHSFRGRATWVRHAGHAIEPAAGAELYRDLYAAAAPPWVARGYFIHYILLPMADMALLTAWAALGFALDQAYALRAVTEADEDPGEAPAGVTIRHATPDDRAALYDIAPLTSRHQAGSPAFSVVAPEDIAELRKGYAELVDDPAWRVWLAVEGDRLLGVQAYHPMEPADGDLLTPNGCTELKAAATREEARGRGIGLALTRHGLADAWTMGCAYCATDWHVPNLLASRFWPQRGFTPMFYRLKRQIDPRIGWANGRPD
jgi:GNAT superfamily N-acetyltransferase